MNRFTAECLGTFFLCLFTLLGSPFGVCLGLAALVWSLGPVSGGYFNPAVTFSQGLRGAITAPWAFLYLGAQMLGATLAALVSALLVGYSSERAAAAAAGFPDDWLGSLGAELLGTMLLAGVVLGVANSRRTAGNGYAALAVGGAVFAAGAAFGTLSAFLNPAVTWAWGLHDLLSAFRAEDEVGKAIAAEAIRFGKFLPWAACLVAAQLAGAALANVGFRLTHPEEHGGGR